jgi:hypothetical protein
LSFLAPGLDEDVDTALEDSDSTDAGTNAGASACNLVNWPPNALPPAVPSWTVGCTVFGRPLPLPLLLFPLDGFCSLDSVEAAAAVLGGAIFNVLKEGWWRRASEMMMVL